MNNLPNTCGVGTSTLPTSTYGQLAIKTTSSAIDLINSDTSGWGNIIRFYDGRYNLRQMIYDDFGTGNLVIQPGWSGHGSGVLNVNGVVQIGNVTTPNSLTYTGTSGNGGYSLYVQYGVLAESFKVAPSTSPDWFDQVFDSSYALRPLSDVEQYVRTNRHLPDIPSADDVAKNGIDVAKMDGRLLQKVEELTLYVIQLKSELDKLKTAKK